MKKSAIFSPLLLLVGLSLWTLGPYGGCSCNNPLGPNDGPTPTPSPTQGPLVDTWEDGDLLNEWGGSTSSAIDGFGSTLGSSLIASTGNPAGTSGKAAHLYGNIVLDGPPNYPYAQLIFSLGGARNMLGSFSAYNGVQLAYKWDAASVPAGASFFVVARTPQTVTDFGYWRFQVFPVDTAWHTLQIYFPNKAGTPKFAQPPWAAARPWDTGVFPGGMSGTRLEYIDISIQPRAGVSTAYDVLIDDVTFF